MVRHVVCMYGEWRVDAGVTRAPGTFQRSTGSFSFLEWLCGVPPYKISVCIALCFQVYAILTQKMDSLSHAERSSFDLSSFQANLLAPTTCARLAIPVRIDDNVRIVLSSEIGILRGADAAGEHSAGVDSRSVLWKVGFAWIDVQIGVDKQAAFDLVAGR